ncbi:MAG: hypothetical protein NTY65_12645 [Planctomycetota bacterium]|nr:hypothetical protein [Planctomycetota bacterium]
MSTTAKPPKNPGPYVTRDVCEALHGQQTAANERTWEEIRTLRRLVILLVVGGQLFSGGLNVAGLAYWLEQHTAQPHPATIQMLAAARAEVREDLRDLKREVRELAATASNRPQAGPLPGPNKKGDPS